MSDEEKEWRRVAGRLARFLNTAWWIDRFAPLLVAASLAGAVALLLLRNARAEPSIEIAIAAIGGALLLLASLAWLLARRHFISSADACVRLEMRLRLHNALSAALEGVAPWPAVVPRDRIDTGYTWRWSRLVAPLALSATLLIAALVVPVRPLAAVGHSKPEEPLAWEQMETWLKELSESRAADEADLERAAERIAELRSRPEEEWYRHSGMEASDTLKQQLADSIRLLEKSASRAGRSVDALRNHSARLSDTNRQRLLSEFDEALRGMKSGNIRPDAGLMQALEGIDPERLESLSPSQARSLSDALANCSSACDRCLGGTGEPAGWRNDADLLSDGAGAPGGRFPEGTRIERGPGEAPLTLSDQAGDLGTRNPEGVASKDYSRAMFGDTLGVGEAGHRIDPSGTDSRAAGALRSQGQGGEGVWRENLLPAEREILKRYFK